MKYVIIFTGKRNSCYSYAKKRPTGGVIVKSEYAPTYEIRVYIPKTHKINFNKIQFDEKAA